MKLKYIIAAALLTALATNTRAQNVRSFDLNLQLGYNIGATAPIPLPAEVRKINSYNPKFNPSLGLTLAYGLNEKWGLGAGVVFDWKGMRVKDEVKYMHTTVTNPDGDGQLTGYFVGENMTNVNMTYLTVPIYATYSFNPKWQVKLGIYAAKALSFGFDGNVNNGYIRIDTPTGQKQEIDGEGASFDFNNDIRDYDFGFLAGGEYRLSHRFGVYANLAWGVVPFFYKNSNPIEFTMTNIYGTVGITYRFR